MGWSPNEWGSKPRKENARHQRSTVTRNALSEAFNDFLDEWFPKDEDDET
jgi:hypothetical protein